MAGEETVDDAQQSDLLPVPVQKQLPKTLGRFAPPDALGEKNTRERLARMTLSALRARRNRIDARLYELGLELGELALDIPSVRGSGLVDLDRILRKIDRIDHVRDLARLEREGTKPDGLLQAAWLDLQWVGEVFSNRELRTRRNLLASELGLALSSCDFQVLGTYAPHVKAVLAERIEKCRRVDELFIEARLLDEEFERRIALGLSESEPKDIDRLLSLAKDSVDDVSSKVGDTLVDFGKTAASAAARTGGQATWAVARGVARGAWALGTRPFRQGETAPADLEAEALDDDERAPAPRDIPTILRDLARLKDEGVLTEAEFARKKAELLRRL